MTFGRVSAGGLKRSLLQPRKVLLASMIAAAIILVLVLRRRAVSEHFVLSSKSTALESLRDMRPMLVRDPDAIAVCFVFSTILSTGGVEQWFWTLQETAFSTGGFRSHAVQLIDYWNDVAAARFVNSGMMLNPGVEYLIDTCDIIVQTGSQPLPELRLPRRVPRIMVIHGSKGCQWTWRYAKHAPLYDAVVGVSRGAVEVIRDEFPVEASKALVIPSAVSPQRVRARLSRSELFAAWHLPGRVSSSRVLLYLGRISSEKDPQYYVDTVERLPSDWIGIMVGPSYFDGSFPELRSDRVFMVGRWDNVGDALSVADAVLLPSPVEGGPIVLLEAWAARVPFFMRDTGLAHDYPKGVFFVQSGETPQQTAQHIVNAVAQPLSAESAAVVEEGFRTVRDVFSIDIVVGQWQSLLRRVYETTQICSDYSAQLLFRLSSQDAGLSQVAEGRTRTFTASDDAVGTVFADLALSASHCRADWVRRPLFVTLEYAIRSVNSKGQLGSVSVLNADRTAVLTESRLATARFRDTVKLGPVVVEEGEFVVRVRVAAGASVRVSFVGVKFA